MTVDEFGARVREFRRQRGWSQERLAKVAGVSPDTISRIERARFHPTLETIVKLAKAFHIPIVGLLKDDFDRPDELAALIRDLPDRDQQLAFVLVGALRVRLAVGS